MTVAIEIPINNDSMRCRLASSIAMTIVGATSRVSALICTVAVGSAALFDVAPLPSSTDAMSATSPAGMT